MLLFMHTAISRKVVGKSACDPGGVLPYKGLMGRAASQVMFFGIFVLNKVSILSFFVLIRVSILSVFVLNRVSFLGR